jgi:hypothetical protein
MKGLRKVTFVQRPGLRVGGVIVRRWGGAKAILMKMEVGKGTGNFLRGSVKVMWCHQPAELI